MNFRQLNIYYCLLTIVFLCALCGRCGLVFAEMATMHAFNRGEVTGEISARSDIKPYYFGCRKLENFYCQTHGGAGKRPGTYYIAESADSDTAGRLIGFGRTAGTNNVLEFGDKTIRFCKGE